MQAIRVVVGPCCLRVDVQEDVDEEIQEEGDGVDEQDVGDVGDGLGAEEGHLLLGGGEEEEAGGVEELQRHRRVSNRWIGREDVGRVVRGGVGKS